MESKEIFYKGDGNLGLRSYWNGWEMYRFGRVEGFRYEGFFNG